jgi:hypothetical protein
VPFYSVARTDRSGATITDMLWALAHARARNVTYLGACYVKNMSHAPESRQAEKVELISALGLRDLLPFACPPDLSLVSKPEAYKGKSKAGGGSRSPFSPEFLGWVRSRASSARPPPPAAPSGGSAVVHIRRGDIDPCRRWKDRYLPSSYFAEALGRYVPAGVPVAVYSERASFEPWDEFALLMDRMDPPRNWTLELDAPAADVWRSVESAKYVLFSVSSFAYVPALLNVHGDGAVVVYPPHATKDASSPPLPSWIPADEALLSRARASAAALAAERCRSYKPVRTGRSTWNESRR